MRLTIRFSPQGKLAAHLKNHSNQSREIRRLMDIGLKQIEDGVAPPPVEELATLVRQIQGLSTNANQTVARLHIRDHNDAANAAIFDLQEALNEVRKLAEELRPIVRYWSQENKRS